MSLLYTIYFTADIGVKEERGLQHQQQLDPLQSRQEPSYSCTTVLRGGGGMSSWSMVK